MTDFLTGLVERSFGTVVGIRPRVASLFEPARRSGVPAVDGAGQQESGSFGDERIDVSNAGERRTAPAWRESLEPRLEPPAVTARPSAPFSVSRPDGMTDLTTRPDSAHQSMVPESMSEAGPGRREIVPGPRDHEPRDAGPRPALPASPEYGSADAGRKADARAVSVAIVAPQTVNRDERGLLVPSRIGAEVAVDLQNAVSAWNSKPPDRVGSLQPATMDRMGEAEQNVHVTIGRIEVRATAGEKASPRQRPPSPVMSLDEYLRQQVRRGGQ